MPCVIQYSGLIRRIKKCEVRAWFMP